MEEEIHQIFSATIEIYKAEPLTTQSKQVIKQEYGFQYFKQKKIT